MNDFPLELCSSWHVFKRVHTVTRSAYYLRLSAYISTAPTRRILVKFLILGTSLEICRGTLDLVEIGQKISGSRLEDFYVKAIKASLSSTDCFYIVDSDM